MAHYNVALVITGAIKGTLRDRIYRELCLKPLTERGWSCKNFFFRKIINCLLPVTSTVIYVSVFFLKLGKK